ncbi:chromosome partition protein Smc [Clostridium tepidiprofundi DSM 19306]|uniref:Chromosome partition protein Smc n=1 Tax=Clostridium tepidiprofundi DSM 19306 TaxID=1121338 RepID=A0A151B5Z9_9CLOT|nr:TIGR02680 family protein [Clostridium tepidiprofundi]KYH35067.1 chromosome partition protein Smc [Clostridium tepidiprofundi DSM 19306]
MENRWIANKFGLINFWYYDIEEFPLEDGKLLFRGSNGSGKSVTMQSFVPLLLDGNKSPERLDPFGTKSRKMENYLLDENTDEKTAYLYIEFKRRKTDNYLTIGMGMKAVKNRPLNSWYFIITDGRRINKDLFLYRNAGNNIPLTKKQLQNEIGNGGVFTEYQREYMKKVNEYLFGFDDVDRYEELINLLIQLRSPKLSKDFKPTEIYKILTQSLRLISEEDLRPMSESMENMDGLQSSLEELKNALSATRNIKYHYDRYNKCCLYEKALNFKKKNDEVLQLTKEIEESKEKLENNINQIKNVKENIKRHKTQLHEAEIMYDKLRENDALRVKEELLKLEKEVRELKIDIEKKENELQNKKISEREKEYTIKKLEDEYDIIVQDIENILDELYEIADEFLFKDGFMLKEDMMNDLKGYDIKYIKICLNKYSEKIRKAIKVLKKYEYYKAKYDEVLENKESIEKEFEDAKNDIAKREEILLNTREDLKVNYVKWNDENTILKLTDEEKKELISAIDSTEDTFSLGDLNKVVKETYNNIKNKFNIAIEKKDSNITDIEKDIDNLKSEIEELKRAKEVEPPRCDGSINNRQELMKRGIPFTVFYKAIDFKKDVPEDIRIALESAFVDMGIIDAVIVDEKYKDEVMSFTEGAYDRYIFANGNIMKHNITNYFDVDKDGLNGVAFETVDNILQGIFLVEDSMAFVDEKGNYSIGIIKGKASTDYTLKYIGASSRKKHRERIINEKLNDIEKLLKDIKELELEKLEIENKIGILDDEMGKEPSSIDLREALKMIYECESKVKELHEKLIRENEALFNISEEFKECKKNVIEITDGMELDVSLEEYEEANERANDYRNLLTELTIKQGNIRGIHDRIESIRESLEDIREVIDSLYYDITSYKNKCDNKNEEINSLKDVLKNTDIEQIEAEIERCIEIKSEYPNIINNLSKNEGELEQAILNINKTIDDKNNKLLRENHICKIKKDIFMEEYSLGYVLPVEDSQNDAMKILKKVIAAYDLREDKDREVYSRAVIDSLSKNRSELREFYIKVDDIFVKNNMEDESLREIYKGVERIDINCKFRGKDISFYELPSMIEKDIEEMKILISNKERAIFEEILMNTISTKIKSKIYLSKVWVDKINDLMESMNTSSSLKLSLRWVPKKAESEGQLNIAELLEIMERGAAANDDDMKKLALHFGNKVKEAIRNCEQNGEARNYYTIIKEVLDYRKWYEFKLYFTKKGERKKELTNNAFFQFSGGEKAMSMYVPLFSAVYARYDNANKDCPKIISMDEAFAGVDENNIRDMFKLLKKLDLDYVLNSQILWGDYDTVDNLSICELIREENDDVVTVIRYRWNGIEKQCLV